MGQFYFGEVGQFYSGVNTYRWANALRAALVGLHFWPRKWWLLAMLLAVRVKLGEVPEWPIGTDSKSVVPFAGHRGFESLPLRQFPSLVC
jgi:hypothetical protein